MPTYDYHCSNCGQKMEAFQKITDPALTKCPKCSEDKLRRGPGGGIGLSFTGSGWYKTDYASAKGETETKCCPCGKSNKDSPCT